MGRVAGERADWTVLTSDNPRSEDPQRIIDEMAAGVPDSSAVDSEIDRAQAIAMALAAAHSGDVVVIAGKGNEQEQELADRVLAFDDREVARRALRGLRAGALSGPQSWGRKAAIMRAVTLSEMVQWTAADPVGSLQPDRALQAVATDSRSIDEGALFVALRGEHFDGHDFVEDAFARGACAALVERCWLGLDRAASGPLLAVDSTLQALGDMARAYRRRWEIPVVAVVGSAGKTTTKEMIAAVLGQRYRVLKTIGSENNEIGVPRTLLQLSPRHEAWCWSWRRGEWGTFAICVRLPSLPLGFCSTSGLHT